MDVPVRKNPAELIEENILLKQRIQELEQSELKLKCSLQESEQQYKSLVDNIVYGINLIDKDFKIITTNAVTGKQFNKSERELVGKYCFKEFEKRDTVCQHCPGVQAMATGQPRQVDTEGVRDDGSHFFARIHAFPLFYPDGTIKGFTETVEDITKRKRMEKALIDSEERYRLLIETTSDWIWETDAHGVYTYASPQVKDMLGYEPQEVLGKTPFDLMPPHEAERVTKIILPCIEMAEPIISFENMVLHKDGQIVVFETSGVPIIDKNGHLKGYRGIDRDVSDRKNVEKQLRLKAFVLDQIEDRVTVTDLSGNISYVNKAETISLGHSREELIGRHVELYGEDSEQGITQNHIIKETLEQGFCRGEIVNYTKNGRKIFMDCRTILVRDDSGIPIAIAGVATDITERKRAEIELQKAQTRYRLLFEHAPDAIVIIDPATGRLLDFNEKAHQQLCYSREEFAKLSVSDVEVVETSEDIRKHIEAIVRKGRDDFETMHRTRQGEIRNIHVTAQMTEYLGQRVYYCVWRDITEQRKLEERLKRAEKMEGLGRLAGGVAHDLNNVLGILVGYSELLAEAVPGGSPLKKYAENILQSGMRGAAIIQDLLTLSRRGVIVSEVVNLNHIVNDYLKAPELEKLKFDYPGVKISTDLAIGLLNIKGSPIHLEKTVMNLILNAVEAISGTGQVMIRTENRYLDMPIRGYDSIQHGDYAVLTVSDTGNGISNDYLDKIFEPFYTRKVMGRSGTGLGLAVVWGTVKDHNGYIDVQSEEGKGTTFTLYFPVTSEGRMEVRKALPPETYSGRGESILVVDDMPDQRELALSMLRRLGYRVDVVSGGEEAVTWLYSKKTDLVVLDMIMDPGMDGLETYQRVLEINPKQKAIIVSGFSQTERVEKVQKLGAGAYVRKPYILENLGLAVRQELDRIL